MGRRIVAAILLVIVVVFAVYFYRQWHAEKALADGSVRCDGCMTPEQHDAFLRENSGETADGQSERKYTAKNSAAGESSSSNVASPTYTDPVRPNVIPAGQTTVDRGATTYPAANAPSQTYPSQTYPSQTYPGQTYPAQNYARNTSASTTSTPPDALPANPPNGVRYGGSGPYEWYRQGNLTWRINTLNGTSCIVYATPEEWRKPAVMRHGCGASA